MMTTNEMKRAVLESITILCTNLENKVKILDALDRDADEDGAYNLHDQLTTFFKTTEGLRAVTDRSFAIVPEKK